MIYHYHASIVVITYEKKVLLILRDDKSWIASPNKWAFVGGRKEEGEDYKETAIREAKEEINIELKKVTDLCTLQYENKTKKVYLASLSKEQLDNLSLSEGQEMKFFSLKEAQELDLAPSSEKILTKYHTKIEEYMNAS